uniref:Uncharacterized protein n=1 Tax=Acrobeloides nanus TaxID=290746 RepID=A0A914CST6_9BILA
MASKMDDAKKSLEFYQCAEDWENSLNDIVEEFEVDDSDTSDSDESTSAVINGNQKNKQQSSCTISKPQAFDTIISRFKTGRFVRPLLISAFVQTFIHLDDWLWISYSTQVFENAGLSSRTAMRASLYMSLPQAFLSVSLLFCFDSFSRRWLLIAPTIGSIICSIMAVFGLMRSDGKLYGIIEMSRMMPIFAAIDLSLAAFASESAYSVVPELFSQKDRILGTAIVGITQNFFGGILSNVILSIVNIYGTQYVLLPFIFLNIIYVIGIYWWLPETNGKSFQVIAQYFKRQLPGSSAIFAIKRWITNLTRIFKPLLSAPSSVNGRKLTSICVVIAQVFLFAFVMHIFLRTLASYFFMYKYS